MIPLDRSLAELVESGRVELESALAIASDGGLQLRELLRASAPARAQAAPPPPAVRGTPRGPYR
jgi:hypothetical protein